MTVCAVHGLNIRRLIGNARHLYSPGMWLDTRRHIPGTRVEILGMGMRYEISKRICGEVYCISFFLSHLHRGHWRRALAWELWNARRKMRAYIARHVAAKAGIRIDPPHVQRMREREAYLAGMYGHPPPFK